MTTPALIVEDGSIVDGADTFIALDEAVIEAEKLGIDIGTEEEDRKKFLRQGYAHLMNYNDRVSGSRISHSQTGLFPRKNCIQENEFEIGEDEISAPVIKAQLMAADAFRAGYQSNKVDDGAKLKSFTVVGAYSEEYQDSSSTKLNPTIQGVYNVLKVFYSGSSNRLTRECGGYQNGWF